MGRLTVGVSLGWIASVSGLSVLTRLLGESVLSPWLKTAYFAALGTASR